MSRFPKAQDDICKRNLSNQQSKIQSFKDLHVKGWNCWIFDQYDRYIVAEWFNPGRFAISALMKILISCSLNINNTAITHTHTPHAFKLTIKAECVFLGAAVNNSFILILCRGEESQREKPLDLSVPGWSIHTQWSNVTVDSGLFFIVIQVSGHTGDFLFRGKISQWVADSYWSTIRAAYCQLIWIQQSTVFSDLF